MTLARRGLTEDEITDIVTETGAMLEPDRAPVARGRQATVTAQPTGRRKSQPFVKPDTTRTLYRLSRALRNARDLSAALDKLGMRPGTNNRVVLEFVAEQPEQTADTRQMRASILKHALHADGINKAIESAVHNLSSREPALLERLEKPADA